METRTVTQRLDDLEHDNNMLRERDAERQVEYQRLESEFEAMGARCNKLIRVVNEFIGRFARVAN
jgi:hypothetical protein